MTGDAETKSWEVMQHNGLNLHANCIKVAHHGSINGAPDWAYTTVFARSLRSNAAIISTDPTRYTGVNEVPNDDVIRGWRRRLSNNTRLKRTDELPLGDDCHFSYRFTV